MDQSSSIPEVALDEAWEMLAADTESVLIDVRTKAEWQFVGVPTLDDLGREVRFIEWIGFPGGEQNTSFVSEVAAETETDQPILLLCRSGARSLAAAKALRSAGYTKVYNVTAGFEGDLGPDGHRSGGWKDSLTWKQS